MILDYVFVAFLLCMAFCLAANLIIGYLEDKRKARYEKIAKQLGRWCRNELIEGNYSTARRIFKVYCRHYLKYRPNAARNEMEDSIGYR